MQGVVVQIEGSPVRLVYGDVPARAFGGEARLVSPPDPSGSGFAPDTGASTSSRMSLSVSANGASRLVFLATAGRPRTTLAASVTAAATVLTTPQPLSFSGGSYVWLGEEVMQVVSVSGTNVTVIRGLTGVAHAHTAGTYIWQGSPYWRRRRANMTVFTDLVASGQWTGFVDGPPETSADSTVINIGLCGVWTLGSDIMSNRGALPSFATVSPQTGAIEFEPATSPVRDNAPSSSLRVWQIAGAMFANGPGAPVTDGLLSTPRISQLGMTDEELQAAPIYELFVTGSQLPFTMNSMAGATRVNHPIHIALALLGVHPDVQLSAPWRPGVAQFWNASGVAAALALSEASPSQAIDHLVLGWNGNSFTVLELVRDLLKLWGYYLVEGSDGFLSIVSYLVGAALSNPPIGSMPIVRDMLLWTGARGGAADRVVAEFGELPFRAGASLELTLRQGQLDSWNTVGETLVIEAHSISLVNGAALLAGQVVEAAYRRLRGQPTLRVMTRGPVSISSVEGPPKLGSLYRIDGPAGLSTPIFPLEDGTITSALNGDGLVGWCVGVRWLVKTNSYEVTLQLNNWPLGSLFKVRAPNSEVLSATQPTTGVWTVVTSGQDFGSSLADTWSVGQRVAFYSADGVLGSAGGTIISINPPNLTVTGAFIAPSANQIIRLDLNVSQPANNWNHLNEASFYA